MHSSYFRGSLLVGILLGVQGALLALPPAQAVTLTGTWRSNDCKLWLSFEEGRVITLLDGEVTVRGLLSVENQLLILLDSGKRVEWSFSLDNATLSLGMGERVAELQRASEPGPSALGVRPIPLGQKAQLPEARVQKIASELARRMEEDQEVRKSRRPPSAIQEVADSNTTFLKTMVQEIGWIDVERFGRDTAFDAALLAKHSRDLPLMLAALPEIERDFKNPSGYAEAFAILYDSVQLRLGGRQRYGTQIGWIDGKAYVLAVSAPQRVDSFRAEIGLPPLEEYLATTEEYLGEKVGILSSEGEPP